MKKNKEQKKINKILQHNELLAKKGLVLREMESDGNCLFRSVADQLYGDQSLHSDIRKYVIEYLKIEKPYFINFIAEMEENSKKGKRKKQKIKQKQEKQQKENEQIEKQVEIEPKNELDLLFDKYVQEMSENGTWGDNIEIQIISEIYQRSVEIYVAFQETPMRTFHENQDKFKVNEPIRLSYHGECHYNSIKSLNHEKLIQEKIGVVEEESIHNARNRLKNLSSKLNDNGDSLLQNFYNSCRSQFQLYDNEELYNRFISQQSEQQLNENAQSNEGYQMSYIYQSELLNHQNDNQDLALQIAIEESKYLMDQMKIQDNDQNNNNSNNHEDNSQQKQNLIEEIPDNKIKELQFQQPNDQINQIDYEKIIVINSVVNAGFSKEQAEQAMQIVGPNEDLIVNYIIENMM
ncbi:OTU-like cysteine protease (macronuclear) [Tetrahymena thermophila SB210]|uniref:ubiquitinyl hydrolase 1 n=1 Tax=Tetrahymena thermophila (strain SB210) TaxID=312017 RepID=Q23HB7_TETTS|nr:OTU-like cysteine protease [Tetrahymena thermophila SB210]EAR95891.1 OTU-like cysteine protease [Tetrahymena thermophila SB210]|eukprot:XP_001016136.1 OTU-like cysteine protease [Tetrahymena thermophila SB210]